MLISGIENHQHIEAFIYYFGPSMSMNFDMDDSSCHNNDQNKKHENSKI